MVIHFLKVLSRVMITFALLLFGDLLDVVPNALQTYANFIIHILKLSFFRQTNNFALL